MSTRPSDNIPSYTVTDGHQYPPNASPTLVAPVPRLSDASMPNVDDDGDKDSGTRVEIREFMRTPSPTPSEKYVLTHKSRSCDIKKYFTREKLRQPKHILTIAITLVVVIVLILFLAFQQKVVNWMRPFANWMHDTPGGWIIPIAIMFVLSFPPLFGHEIIAVLCGDVWGVWIGFGIVAAGTLLGELGNFYAFKYWCMARGKKMEETQMRYAVLAQVVREGGFKIPVIMRLSAIPGHFLTAIFSTLGMSVWTFIAAATLGLPKQLAVVYIGVSQSSSGSHKTAHAVKAIVIIATVIVTHLAMLYIYRKMDEVKAGVVYKRRKARQAKMLAASGYPRPDGAIPMPVDIDLERARDVESRSGISMRTAVANSQATDPFATSGDTTASTAALSAGPQRMSTGARGLSASEGDVPSPGRARRAAERRNGERELRR
ncbi:hypothetical protein DICSQDRAFT_164046 [Dichomitus squalens LYAD-421 SS1]|uniref:Golgi apparatus membrane protein TVP38 n=1 Tax=Dichomitus squalens (strain LYAD-421) TaxID=732165 RepID=R7SIL5_DICSQ|nr:uncharacterized protein DICSQDRAFT_164046 [Dichomitus squalens LYAD-421 SS1]EJF56011.1 hypothetical protein DICSQDRAFT_164046 [Dichomitus squalens LYAD-421 SS1]